MSDRGRMCAVVEDLLPLWREGLVSTETSAFLEEHLADCPHCKELSRAARGVEQRLAAQASPGESAGETPEESSSRFLRRLRRRKQAVLAGIGALVVAAGALGAAASSVAQPTAAQRYQQFLDTVPGYGAAAVDGSLVPLHQTVRIGDETVTLRAFYATYFGSYVVFTAQGQRGTSAVVPNVSSGREAIGPAPGSSAPTGKGALAGYVELTGLQVPTPFTLPKYRYDPTSFQLRFSLAAVQGSRATVFVRVPKSAYSLHGAVTRRHPLTVHAPDVTVRLESLEISSAGTLVRGEARGAVGAWIVGPKCLGFLGSPNCDRAGQGFAPPGADGWQPFYWIMEAPPRASGQIGAISLPLRGVEVLTPMSVTATVDWPPKVMGQGVFRPPQPVALGRSGAYRVALASNADESGVTVQVRPSEKNQRLPRMLGLQGISVMLPDGTITGGTNNAEIMDGEPGKWEWDFPAKWKQPPTREELTQAGRAKVTVTLNTYPLHAFPKGTVWRP